MASLQTVHHCPVNMHKVVLASAVVLALLCLAGLFAPVSGKDGCSKDWMRYMVLNACGMEKRHLDRKKLPASHQMNGILDEVMLEMDRMHHGNVMAEEEEDKLEEEPVASHSDPEVADKSEGRGMWTRLSEHPVELLRQAEEWMGLSAGAPAPDTRNKYPRRRAIQNMITHCCSDECSSDDFEGIC